jgi:hypothetical protein
VGPRARLDVTESFKFFTKSLKQRCDHGVTQSPTEMSTRNFLQGSYEGRLVHEFDNVITE